MAARKQKAAGTGVRVAQRPAWLVRGQAWLIGYLFAAPALILLAAFWIYPIIQSLYLSFTSWDMLSPKPRWIGIENYVKLFASPEFRLSLANTAVFTVATVLLTGTLALVLAVLLDTGLRAASLYRTLIFSPYVTPTVAAAVVWLWVYEPNNGLANWMLSWLGLPRLRWLASTELVLVSLILMNIWKYAGYYMLLFLAGLQRIPGELYEAAALDGAGPWHRFRHVTLPLLSATSLFIVIVGTIQSFQVFDQVAVMTQGGPANASLVLVFYLYRYAFQFFEVGYASAAATVLFGILLVLTLLQFAFSRRWVHYS